MLPSTLDMAPSPSTWNPRLSTLDKKIDSPGTVEAPTAGNHRGYNEWVVSCVWASIVKEPTCIIISSLSSSSSSSSSPSSFIHFIQNVQENPMKSPSQWYTVSQRKGKGRGIEVEWGERLLWKGVETGERFDRQERVIIVQMEGNKVPRTERGLAAWWMLSPLSLAKSL